MIVGFLCFLIAIGFVGAQTETFRFANYYADSMVLQRAPARLVLWGYVPDCRSVNVNYPDYSFNATLEKIPGKTYCRWKIDLPPAKAGGPYTISAVSGNEGIELKDVLFGDVWVCSGQSNMVFELSEVYNATTEIANAASYTNIRILSVNRVPSNSTLDEPPLTAPAWNKPSSTAINSFSAVCWLYGRDLYDTYKVPIGLISSDWGGTSIDKWSSHDALAKCKQTSNEARAGLYPSNLWNAMIHPFVRFPIYGAIWYQGEANARSDEEDALYRCYFSEMIKDWRLKWYEGTDKQTKIDFPFGFVQLAAEGTEGNKSAGFFPGIRWSLTGGHGIVPNDLLPNVFMAVAMDLGDPTSPHGSVHPRDKQDVAIRLSRAGRAIAYGDTSLYYTGPLPVSATITDLRETISAKIMYRNVEDKLYSFSKYGFELSCKERTGNTVSWIEGTLDTVMNDYVTVSFPRCPAGDAVGEEIRYAWRQDPCVFKKCAIYSGSDYLFPSPPYIIPIHERV
uniref:Sialate O-acetylesterase domain-containing protein n=1 Tax=Amphimedon queenslandica TaxID=400682 RepID=A0A1X7VPF4_AMPQE